MAIAPDPPGVDGLQQLRHDLLNPLNVLIGATNALAATDLDDQQRKWARVLQSTAERLMDIANRIERYRGGAAAAEGQARLADLCSIAEARVGKPFDREHLIEAIERVAGRRALRLLLVDDSPELALLVRSYLRDTGWELDVVETGERAVAQATTERYDVVLMDIDLPGLDGATAAHAIRAADLARGASPTPVIAMTAFDAPAMSTHVRIDDPEIASLVPGFLESRRDELQLCRQALEAGEFPRIQSSAHRMKGTGRGYGFDEISRIGAALEDSAYRRDGAAVARLLDQLDSYLRQVTVVS